MRSRTLARLIWWSAAIAALGGCAATGDKPIEAISPQGTEMVESVETPPPQIYRFYPGDELKVTAVNRPELTISTRVDPYGYIAYPYLGQVAVKNLTPQEVAERLTQGLREGGYYNRALLGVSFVASKEQFIYVLGEVKRPGAVAINGNISLLDAIGKAGGQTYDAEMSTVLWIRGRQSPAGVVKLNLNSFGDPRNSGPGISNLTLIPGDVLYIPDSVIASVERFFGRILNIIRPVVELERGIVLYPEVERFLRGNVSTGEVPPNTNTIIIR